MLKVEQSITGEVLITDERNRQIVIKEHSNGILVENKGDGKSTAIYHKINNRDVIMFSDANPKDSWQEFSVL